MKGKIKLYVFYILLISAVIFSIYLAMSFNTKEIMFNCSDVYSYDKNWTYEKNGVSKTINLPYIGSEKPGEQITVSNILPDAFTTETYIYIRTSQQSLIVMLDGQEIYSYGTDKSAFFGKANGSAWNLIKIPSESAGKKITFVFESPYKPYCGNINLIQYGSRGAVIFKIAQENILGLISAILVFIMAVVFMMFYFLNKRANVRDIGLIYISAFSFLIAIWMFGECRMSQFFIGNQFFITSITFLSLILSSIPMLLFVEQACVNSNKKVFNLLYVILTLCFIISFTLQIFKIYDFIETVFIYHTCVLFSAIITYVMIIREVVVYRNRNIRHILVSISLIIVSCLLEIISYYSGNFINVTSYFKIGLLVFIFYLAAFFSRDVHRTLKKADELKYYEKLAYTDFLTKCKNRTAFNIHFETLSNQIDNFKNLFVAIFDLNDLKYINDTYGHLKGDEALIACCECIKDAYRAPDNTYRIGGDEFVCIIYDCTLEEFENRMKIFKNCVSMHMQKANYPFNIAMGYASFDKSKDINLYGTFNRADKEMYNNKNNIKTLIEHGSRA